MPTKFLSSFLLLVAAAAGENTVELAGGLKAEVVSMDRMHGTLTLAVRISNNSKDSAFILLFGEPSAFDDAGEQFSIVNAVTGAAYCPGPQTKPPTFRLCVGLPRVTDSLFPLQRYTGIEPGKSVTAQFRLSGGGDKGSRVSLTQQIAYRFTKDDDRTRDSGLSDAEKVKSLHIGTLNFDTAPGEIDPASSSLEH
jgi:hypothetical protein